MKYIKPLILLLIGGFIYILIEVVFRAIVGHSPTHWSMFILGGLSFVCIGSVNEYIGWDMPFWLQDIIGTIIVLILEFLFGCVLNLWLKLDIWDYSNLPLNILGQVCIPFTFAWMILSAVAIVLDDYLRYWLFGEDKPRYKLI